MMLAHGAIAAASSGFNAVPYIVGALAVLFPGGVLALVKYRPERTALVITQTEGATKILNGVIEALEAQHDRDQATIARYERELAAARSEAFNGGRESP